MNNKKKQRRRRYLRRIGLTFTVCIGIFAVTNAVKKDRTFSALENRILSGKPEISVDRLVDGSFMKEYESYYVDQFAGRDWFVRLKAGVDMLAGRRKENGVYNGKDHYLMEEIKTPDQSAIKDNVEAMKRFGKAYPEIPFRMMMVPNAAGVLKDKLPSFTESGEQKKQIANLKQEISDDFTWIDVQSTMEKHAEKGIYYRTDHHWTTQAAYQVFKAHADDLGLDEKALIKMQLYRVTEDFNGTLSSISGYETGYKEPISIAVPKKESERTEYVVTYPDEQRKEATIYDSSKLKEKDKYAVFFGGNYPELSIHTTSDSTAKLLVLKDSYANCFVQFLLPYYREIVMVDPRYYSGSMKTLMTEHRITDVLFLYNMNTFVEDNNISGVLEEYGEGTAE